MKTFFKRYFFLLDIQAKRQLPMMLLIFMSSSFLDVIGIGLVGAFLLLIVNFNQMLHKLPLSLQHFLSGFTENHVIFSVGIGLIFAFILKGFWGIFVQKKTVFLTTQFTMRLKMRLMKDYQNAEYSFHLRQNSAYLLNKISLADSFSNSALSTSLNIVSSLLVVIGIISCLVVSHPLITLFLAMMVVLIFFSYEFFVKNTIARISKILATAGGEINKSVFQAMAGLKEIRVFGKESFFSDKMAVGTLNYARALSLFNALQLIPRNAVESAASIFLVSMVLGALSIGTSPVNMIPTLGVFAAACFRLLPTISHLISQFSQFRGTAYATNLLNWVIS